MFTLLHVRESTNSFTSFFFFQENVVPQIHKTAADAHPAVFYDTAHRQASSATPTPSIYDMADNPSRAKRLKYARARLPDAWTMKTNTRDRTGTKETCEVLVGGQVFTIDRGLFIPRSAMLRKAIEEANTQQPSSNTPALIECEDGEVCDPKTFSMYQKFVESGAIDTVDQEDRLSFLIQIHIFAWKFRDYTAANASIDLIIKVISIRENAPDLEHIRQVYEFPALTHGSPLKRVMVDFLIHDPRRMSWLAPVDEDDGTALSYLQDVVLEYQVLTAREGRRGRAGKANDIFGNRPRDRDICHDYHKHDEDHKGTGCREVKLRQGSEELGEDSKEAEQDGEGSGQEGAESRS